jgi:hypothetical protein
VANREPNDAKRKYEVPVWRKPTKNTIRPEPPVMRHVVLPEKVAVKFLVEVTGQSLRDIVSALRDLRVFVSVDRSVDFEDADRLLRKYGIGAERQG